MNSIMDWGPIVFWHWWVLSSVLLVLELSRPIFFFLWIGIAAAAVGFLLLLIPAMALEVQLVSFGIMAVVAVVAWRKYRETHPPESE